MCDPRSLSPGLGVGGAQLSRCFVLQEKLDHGVKKETDGMGVPDIKYGDSVCYIQHVDTCLWLTYQTVDAKCARMGGVQRKVRHIYSDNVHELFSHQI